MNITTTYIVFGGGRVGDMLKLGLPNIKNIMSF